jgi:hypothetical protein
VAAGAFAGLAAAIKIYPAAMALGPDPRRRLRFAAGLAGSLLGSWALLSIPLGNPLVYLQGVLLPAAGATDADCGIASVTSFWRRTVGGEPYALPDPAGIRFVTLPLHLPELATALALLSAAAFAGAALWAAWRSGWHPAYGLALGFALGALIPGEVYPYQFLPLLPLALLVAVRAAEARRAAVLAVLLVALLGFVRQPCELPFPNLWSLAGVAVFAIGVWQYGLFRARPAAAAATVGGRVHGDQ